MKTSATLAIKRNNNNELIGELIEQLHKLHLDNQEIERQLSSLQEEDESNDGSVQEEETSDTSIKSGDRAVVLSPIKERRGATGYIKSLSKSRETANFKTDTNQEFQVRVGNLFRLKNRRNNKR